MSAAADGAETAIPALPGKGRYDATLNDRANPLGFAADGGAVRTK